MRQSLFSAYVRMTVGHPVVAGLLVALLFGLALLYAPDFRLDASSDSLVLENDNDLAYYRTVTDRYGSEEFIVVTYTPDGDLFSDETLARLGALKAALAHPKAACVLTWRGKPLMRGDGLAMVPMDHPVLASGLVGEIEAPVFLGLEESGAPNFACDISGWEPAGQDIGTLGSLPHSTQEPSYSLSMS